MADNSNSYDRRDSMILGNLQDMEKELSLVVMKGIQLMTIRRDGNKVLLCCHIMGPQRVF